MAVPDDNTEYLTAHNVHQLMERVCTSLITARPSDTEINQHIYHLLVQEQQQPGSLATQYPQMPPREDAADYLSQSSASAVLEEWIGDMLKQRPEDPIGFSCERFRAKMQLEEAAP